MRLTRRGYGVLAVVAAAEVFAIAYGARALNAVAAPAIVALAAGVVQAGLSDAPTAERDAVEPGFPGDTRDVTVDVDGSGVARVSESVPEGLRIERDRVETSLPGTVEYALTFDERGRHALGPLRVRVRDVLGLVERRHEVGATATVTVYPPVYKISSRGDLLEQVVGRSELERREFETLREYAPGDPLRDVHWKSTAKDPDGLYVTEFADRRGEHDVVIAATASADDDAMAAAAASVAVAALDADLGVELRLPTVTVPPGRGPDQRERVLAALAATDGGDLSEDAVEDADVHVHATADGVTVTVGARTQSLTEMTVSRENPLAAREVRP